MTIPYRFMPWSRRGLARAHANDDAIGMPLAARPLVKVGLKLQSRQDGNAAGSVDGAVDLALYGPADVIGIAANLVVRSDPKPNATNVEPNYLAVVDFDPPDFPWMLTPARAAASGHLRPWLVLVVVEAALVKPPVLRPGRPLPSITLTATQSQTELPDLAESWLWAHSQVVEKPSAGSLPQQMQQLPERNVSRLVCPRRLKANTDYVACVVPATDGGRLRGIGQPFTAATLGPAWTQAPGDIELPVYHSWTFSTGPVGDFETLARRLRTPSQLLGLRDQLRQIGQRPVYVDGDHLLFDGLAPGRTVFEGAMVSIGFQPADPDKKQADKLEAILDSNAAAAAGTPADPLAPVPTLGPPIYGEYPAKRHTVGTARVGGNWLDGISLQPRYRLAAGWGAEIVRQYQDEFMQAAWEQLGDVLAAQRALSLARFSRDVLKCVETRHLAKLSPDRLLAVMAPARARIAMAPNESLYGRIAAATLPHELFDGSMRRLVNSRRATFTKARWRARNSPAAKQSVTAQMRLVVEDFANASTRLASIDPTRFVPDGILGSVSYDSVPVPADPKAVVDMAPFTGLALKLTGAELKAIQAANATARKEAAGTKRRAPAMDDVWHRGLVTETHTIRLAELQRVAGVPLTGDVERAIQQSSRRGTEGVLLSVKEGTVTSQALRIDGRSGALKAFGGALVATPGRAVRAPRIALAAATTVASVPLDALKLYGNSAVFTTLPPSVLGTGREGVKIGLAGPGDFSKVAAGAATIPTITMPPAYKDHATLHRYSAAFKEYQRIAVPPERSLVEVAAIDFPTATNAARARVRVNPDRTVPARLATTLTLGNQAVVSTPLGLSHNFISTRFYDTPGARLRYVVPLTFDRVMAFPHLLFPLARKLEVLAPDVFLPGVGALPNDFIMAVETNPRFIEALMVGANHEMGREMLWQGLPTDQRGTPFQRFWQHLDDAVDIAYIHQWKNEPLGSQPGNEARVVLLIRGQLLERFPNVSIYAYKMKGDKVSGEERRPGAPKPPLPDDNSEMVAADRVAPVIRGHLNQDITYVGFPFGSDELDAHFFIIEEHMTEPRFGFDERVEGAAAPSSKNWPDVDWDHLKVKSGDYFGAAALKRAEAAVVPPWQDPHAAHVAQATLQQPFRGFWHGAALATP